MQTIGLLGGMSYESTVVYYQLINKQVNQKLGGVHSAKILLSSADYAPLIEMQQQNDWAGVAREVTQMARSISSADFILICCNTIHHIADEVQQGINVPLLHIVDPTAEKIQELGLKKVALLGTKATMEKDFFKGRLKDRYSIDTIIPDDKDRELLHNIILHEFCRGIFKESSKSEILKIVDRQLEKGAEGVILGCTELPMLIKQEDCPLPLLDTTSLHAGKAVEMAFPALKAV